MDWPSREVGLLIWKSSLTSTSLSPRKAICLSLSSSSSCRAWICAGLGIGGTLETTLGHALLFGTFGMAFCNGGGCGLAAVKTGAGGKPGSSIRAALAAFAFGQETDHAFRQVEQVELG